MAESESTATPARITKPQPVTLETRPVERSILIDAARRFARNRLAMFGLLIIAFLVFLAIFADVIAPYRYDEADFTVANELPFIDVRHILGADGVGRDYLTRLIYGARTSMIVGLSVPLIAFGIGVTLGAMSGYFGGPLDFFIQRVIEVMTAIPPLMLALFLISITGSGVANVIFVLSITAWLDPTRLTRAQFLMFR